MKLGVAHSVRTLLGVLSVSLVKERKKPFFKKDTKKQLEPADVVGKVLDSHIADGGLGPRPSGLKNYTGNMCMHVPSGRIETGLQRGHSPEGWSLLFPLCVSPHWASSCAL